MSSCDFDEFWACYPRKVAKGAARKAFGRAIRIATMEEILEGVARYRQEIRNKGTEPQFVCHPSTWLNQERWSDEDGLQLGPDQAPAGYRWVEGEEAEAYAKFKGWTLTRVGKLAVPEEWKNDRCS